MRKAESLADRNTGCMSSGAAQRAMAKHGRLFPGVIGALKAVPHRTDVSSMVTMGKKIQHSPVITKVTLS